ncbi:MAG: glycosyltransferase family 9 protein [Candidatus Omnitrophica bacterium]|nr:glycosyltransferase family 9 protein [Candidatus Omnitrophota bacterium]MDD5660377.1 glycosyltransferase family 9 protein [Candidatus Omnitrophota bacterium]
MILKKNAGIVRKSPKFLIINPFGIGDVLFTTPVVKALKTHYPESFIGYWSNIRVKPVLKDNPDINTVFTGNRGDLKKIYRQSFLKGLRYNARLLWNIKKEHFDICLDFSLDHRYSFLAKLIGIKKRIGFNYKERGRFLTDRIDLASYEEKHVIEYYLGLLKFLDISAEDKSMVLAVSAASQAKAKSMLAAYGIKNSDLVVGIAPGAGGSWGKDASYKHWPVLNFVKFADMLINQLKAKVIILGDESERAISDTITANMINKPIDLVGRTDLEILPAIIKSCSLLVTNDGGPMHMAVALGIKSVSVFGPVSENVYGPFPSENKHAVLKRDIACRPCYKNFRLPACDKDRECLKSVSVDEVFQASCILLR